MKYTNNKMKNLELKKMTEAALKRNTMKGKKSKIITSCNSFKSFTVQKYEGDDLICTHQGVLGMCQKHISIRLKYQKLKNK